MKKKEKSFLENKGWKVYDTAWEAVGLTVEEAKLEEAKFLMAQKYREDGIL
ncbi:MAG: hypothetical protein LBB56_00505 [Chitinispirillales bacterium]|jgi:hypothetical protein|nr:hypothetical protein [Chitinispirillales bacterium]